MLPHRLIEYLWQNYMPSQRRQSKYILGAIEAPKAPRGVGSTGGGVWGEGTAPFPEFFLMLDLKTANCGAFFVQFFAVQLKLWGGEKILSPRYIFFGGGGNRPPRPPPPPGSTPLCRCIREPVRQSYLRDESETRLEGKSVYLFSFAAVACTHRWACASTCDYTCVLILQVNLYWTLVVAE